MKFPIHYQRDSLMHYRPIERALVRNPYILYIVCVHHDSSLQQLQVKIKDGSIIKV